ncbi:hypothetical protein [Granulicella mallensis]|jgi:hypothetical protein|uniref:Uncharacterized protein n=1 Tax=Granulicella mallensis TaxID=940614 RepID=A0A7W7ZPP5_9BACT|nr:hypothetical protein [Granulicella mallensis]MBB5063894.1 hypothetical protein [Granulicella mallensis]
MPQQSEHRAEPPRIPASTRTLERAEQERKAYFREREQLEHRSLVRGLLWLAALVLVVSMARAGLGRVFVPGWWRP